MNMIYYHGGPHGLKVGKRILPPERTGALSSSDLVSNGNPHRRDKVYLTSDFEAAVMYACVHERGWIYEVKPVGVLEDDPDCSMPGLSFQCDEAIISKIHKMSYAQTAANRKVVLEGLR